MYSLHWLKKILQALFITLKITETWRAQKMC